MAIPSVERAPGIRPPWLDIWRGALKALKEYGLWAPELRPLLDEYVFALMAADEARLAGEKPTVWDRHAKRASALADQLALTPRGRKAIALKEVEDGGSDPFDALDELAPRRAQAA